MSNIDPKTGKFRVFDCTCGVMCIRPLTGDPKPCDRCGTSVVDRPNRIEDPAVLATRIVQMAKEKK